MFHNWCRNEHRHKFSFCSYEYCRCFHLSSASYNFDFSLRDAWTEEKADPIFDYVTTLTIK
jgi:hypothetical protein